MLVVGTVEGVVVVAAVEVLHFRYPRHDAPIAANMPPASVAQI